MSPFCRPEYVKDRGKHLVPLTEDDVNMCEVEDLKSLSSDSNESFGTISTQSQDIVDDFVEISDVDVNVPDNEKGLSDNDSDSDFSGNGDAYEDLEDIIARYKPFDVILHEEVFGNCHDVSRDEKYNIRENNDKIVPDKSPKPLSPGNLEIIVCDSEIYVVHVQMH